MHQRAGATLLLPIMAELLEDKGVKVIALDLPESVSGSKAFVQRREQNDVPVIVVNYTYVLRD